MVRSFSLAAKQGRSITAKNLLTPALRTPSQPLRFTSNSQKSELSFEKCHHKTEVQKGKAASKGASETAALQNAVAHLAQLPRTYLHMFKAIGQLNTLLSFQASQRNKSSLPAHQGIAESCRHPFSMGGRHRSHMHSRKRGKVSRHCNGNSHTLNC